MHARREGENDLEKTTHACGRQTRSPRRRKSIKNQRKNQRANPHPPPANPLAAQAKII